MDNIPQDTPLKQCNACKKFLPATSDIFHKSKASKDGFAYTCKKCKKAYDEQYNEANREKKREQSRAYNQSHREQINAQNKERQAKHKDEKAAYDKQYRENNKETIREKKSIYYQSNRALWIEKSRLRTLHDREGQRKRQRKYDHSLRGRMRKLVAKHKRRARELSVGGSYTAQQLLEQKNRQKLRCYWCYALLGTGKNAYHADHIVPLSRGGSNDISNIVIACPSCNMSKGDKFPHEWRRGGRLL